jgi:hypothetical protein
VTSLTWCNYQFFTHNVRAPIPPGYAGFYTVYYKAYTSSNGALTLHCVENAAIVCLMEITRDHLKMDGGK